MEQPLHEKTYWIELESNSILRKQS